MHELNRDYEKLLKKIRRKLYFELADCRKTDQILDDLYNVFLDAQNENQSVENFINHDFHEFYQSLLSSAMDYKTQRNKRLKYVFLSVLIISSCLFAGYQYMIQYVLNGIYQVKQGGLSYIMYDSNYYVNYQKIDDIEFTLDLTKDLNTYKNLLIYQDEESKLIISEITEEDNFYFINFYSEGKYNAEKAVIIMTDQRKINEQGQISYTPYSQVNVLSNQNYSLTQVSRHLTNQGLYVGYELFPLEWYERGELINKNINLSRVNIQISGLNKAIFSRL